MHTTGRLLVAAVVCLAVAWLAGQFVGVTAGMALTGLGLLLVVAAIANSYLNDVRQGYRSASEE
ncbi:hypothetical protein [Haloglomus halophilum]|uniref:hypothetical protein n=1 Tax=Haloglomus halophilum TaxID=2962672 RepID=UPI0020CA1B28|nr:hypothetical protein [Haloglomus halophilum]